MSNKKKHKLNVNITLSSTQMWDNIAAKIHVPAEQLKMIHKGHKIDKDDIHRVMAEKAVFQAIGMESLNEEGLDPDNISYIMRKMSTDRNTAISALRLKGDVIDAILYLGNRWKHHWHKAVERVSCSQVGNLSICSITEVDEKRKLDFPLGPHLHI